MKEEGHRKGTQAVKWGYVSRTALDKGSSVYNWTWLACLARPAHAANEMVGWCSQTAQQAYFLDIQVGFDRCLCASSTPKNCRIAAEPLPTPHNRGKLCLETRLRPTQQ